MSHECIPFNAHCNLQLCSSIVVTIPRIIVRDLGDHADKKELVGIYSKFHSFKNVWVANNPPGFAYVFFDNMKDALKAVASTNGRVLCGGRVRVELTPLDEKVDNNRRQMTQRGRPPRRHSIRSSFSPTDQDYRQRRSYYSPESGTSSPPINRQKRHGSPHNPPSKRRAAFSGNHFEDTLGEDESLVRGGRNAKKTRTSSRGPQRERKGRMEQEMEYPSYRMGRDPSRPGKFSYHQQRNVGRDYSYKSYQGESEEEEEGYRGNDKHMSSNTLLPNPVNSYSHLQEQYEGDRSRKMEKEFEKIWIKTNPH